MKFYLELKLKKEPYSFEFKFSPIQPMFQHQPPPQAVPSNAPRDSLSHCRWSSKGPHSLGQLEK